MCSYFGISLKELGVETIKYHLKVNIKIGIDAPRKTFKIFKCVWKGLYKNISLNKFLKEFLLGALSIPQTKI